MDVKKVFFLMLLWIQASCNTPSPPHIQIGTPLFSFDTQKISEILITKSDPSTGESWSARLKKNSVWEISTGPQGPLLDQFAHSTFILHLADTLRTLQAREWAPRGPATSFGLAPPYFALRWIADDQSYEIQFGNLAPHESSPGGARYARIGMQPIFIAHGSALPMLSYIQSFDFLRLKTLTNFTSDDIDVIELKRSNHSLFYAQRQGGDWADSQEKKIRFPVNPFLETLTHLKIKTFCDDSQETQKILKQITQNQKKNTLIIFRDRHDHPTELTFAPLRHQLWATLSSRPHRVFEIDRDVLKTLNSVPNEHLHRLKQKPAHGQKKSPGNDAYK